MARKNTANRPNRSNENREIRRTRMLRIVLIGFSIILILSMILSLANT